jgi:hypothetical protein
MRKLLLVLALAAGAESAALACSCIVPAPPEQSRAEARHAVQDLVAIVEADVLTAYRPGSAGEQVRVRRTLFGKAPKTLRIDRGPFASSASCDLLLERGKRKVLLLRRGKGGAYQMQSLCSDFLTSERYLPVVIQEARRTRATPGKAGERASICPTKRELSAWA